MTTHLRDPRSLYRPFLDSSFHPVSEAPEVALWGYEGRLKEYCVPGCTYKIQNTTDRRFSDSHFTFEGRGSLDFSRVGTTEKTSFVECSNGSNFSSLLSVMENHSRCRSCVPQKSYRTGFPRTTRGPPRRLS